MTKRAALLFVFVGIFTMPLLAGDDQGGDLNKIGPDGKKQGNWVYLGKDRPEAGYPAEGKIEEGPYKDDRKEGTWIRYYNDGVTPKLKGEYHNNRPSGAYEKTYADGTIREIGTFSHNKYDGNLKRYYENGVLEQELSYNTDGQEEGVQKYYHPNGQEEFVYNSIGGSPTGTATRYWPNGDIKEVITYGEDGKVVDKVQTEMVSPDIIIVDPGFTREPAPSVGAARTKGEAFKQNGYNKVYNENDEIWQDGEFRSGSLWNGKVYDYDSDGILLKVRVFKNGYYHSDGQL
jgi:antitoxin component YwqK of YwqJK toxin-antitoxin module